MDIILTAGSYVERVREEDRYGDDYNEIEPEIKAIAMLYNQNSDLIEKIANKEEEIVALNSKLLDKKCIISNLQNDIFKLEISYYNMLKEFIKNIFSYRLKVVKK